MEAEVVTTERLREFFRRLGHDFGREGRIYLVGGTGIVYAGAKDATKDIDLVLEVTPPDEPALRRVLVRLRNDLGLPVKEVSPGATPFPASGV